MHFNFNNNNNKFNQLRSVYSCPLFSTNNQMTSLSTYDKNLADTISLLQQALEEEPTPKQLQALSVQLEKMLDQIKTPKLLTIAA